jgi:hypothetical protein
MNPTDWIKDNPLWAAVAAGLVAYLATRADTAPELEDRDDHAVWIKGYDDGYADGKREYTE